MATYGERAVGLGDDSDPDAHRIKQQFADLIDQLHEAHELESAGERKRLLAIAISMAQTAQLWASKALSFEK